MQPVGQLFLGCIADGGHFTGKVKFLAGQVVVEIHLDAVVADFDHLARDHAAGLVHHRDHPSDDEQLFLDLAVDFEDMLGQIDHSLCVIDAVSLFRAEYEFEGVADRLSQQVFLKFGQQIAESVDELEGLFCRGLVFHFAVHPQRIGQGDDFLILDSHGCHCFSMFMIKL